MSELDLKFGDYVRHLKRGSIYRVIGRVRCEGKLSDYDKGFFTCLSDGHGEQYFLLHPEGYIHAKDAEIMYQQELTFQISQGPIEWAEFFIYADVDSGSVWARPVDEFTEDRFAKAAA